MEPWLIFALLTVVAYGLGEGLSKEPTVRLGSARMLLLHTAYSVPIYATWFFVGRGWETLSLTGAALGVAAAASGAIGAGLWFRAMETGNPSVVSGFTAAYPVITLAAAVMLLGESVLPVQLASIALLVLSATVLGSSEKADRVVGVRSWVPAMILTIVLWGAWGVFEKLAIDSVGYAANAGVYAAVSTPIFLLMSRGRSRGAPWDRKGIVAAQPALALFAVAGITTYLAIGMGPLAVVVPLTTAYPLVAILFRRLWHAERMTRPQTAAVACALLGALLVSL
jgi:drug/metabolite transporter (DMT)-like permease